MFLLDEYQARKLLPQVRRTASGLVFPKDSRFKDLLLGTSTCLLRPRWPACDEYLIHARRLVLTIATCPEISALLLTRYTLAAVTRLHSISLSPCERWSTTSSFARDVTCTAVPLRWGTIKETAQRRSNRCGNQSTFAWALCPGRKQRPLSLFGSHPQSYASIALNIPICPLCPHTTFSRLRRI
ncbi:hypothetical protein C8F04DRAFT_1092826 [Mycena alexandri]|uniref:Uncharacterized protein n=1 Tax=Mycena alexandri TaxID=1745969 RepID=A0AAD6T1B4_9AGAR|nr:hypothetical protein C8F04DRAFT_1092826 [Mycena alexandri]